MTDRIADIKKDRYLKEVSVEMNIANQSRWNDGHAQGGVQILEVSTYMGLTKNKNINGCHTLKVNQ
jgi:hypothetical protein